MKKFSRAFTLIELLVVVAIIVILTGIIMSNLTASRSKARDAQRISDMAQIQLALELYYDRCKQYPASINTGASNCVILGPAFSDYISTIPTPPTNPSDTSYTSYNGGYAPLSGNTDYVFHIKLENKNEGIQKNGLQGSAGGFQCYTVDHPYDYCLGPK